MESKSLLPPLWPSAATFAVGMGVILCANSLIGTHLGARNEMIAFITAFASAVVVFFVYFFSARQRRNNPNTVNPYQLPTREKAQRATALLALILVLGIFLWLLGRIWLLPIALFVALLIVGSNYLIYRSWRHKNQAVPEIG